MDPDQPYLRHVSRAHLDTSAAALSEVADLVSTSDDRPPDRTLRVRIGHLDHGAFLTHLLHGFAMTPFTPDGLLVGADEASGVLYAVIVNQTLEVQLRTALSAVASYLARQEVIHNVRHGNEEVTNLDRTVAEVDTRTVNALDETLRVSDWRTAAGNLRERAIAAGFALRVQFASPLLHADEVRRRVPAMRRVYNRVPSARLAIDKAAAMLSVGLTVVGDGVPQTALTIARELLDVGELGHYLAHLARDAFVCGNGFLEVRPPPAALRLLRPETVEVPAEGRFIVHDPATGTPEVIDGPHVLHIKGMHQSAGLVGVSVLEPLVVPLAQIEVAQAAAEDGARIALEIDTDEARGWVERTQAFAERMVHDNETRFKDLLDGGTAGLAPPPLDLYFPGHEDMESAAARLRFIDNAHEL